MISERGAGLSGGQKQRLAIARALLKQARILIFDEATSSLDATAAGHFASTIDQLKGKATMLFIAHALPKNLQADEIVRIGAGALNAVNVQQAAVKREHEGHSKFTLCSCIHSPEQEIRANSTISGSGT